MKPTNADYKQLHMDIGNWLKAEDANDLEESIKKLRSVAEFCVTYLTEAVSVSKETVCVVGAIYELIDGDEYYFMEDEEE